MLLGRRQYFVKERVGLLKLVDTYDILEPENLQPIGLAKEEPPGWAKFLRLLVNKQMLPTRVNVYEDGQTAPVFSISRGFTFMRSKIHVIGSDGAPLGYFKSKLFSLGGGFFVFDLQDRQIAEVKGDWKGWNFRFLAQNGTELGVVTKKWAGLAKEFLTSADQYLISLNQATPVSDAAGVLLLAAGLAIDIVFKEQNG